VGANGDVYVTDIGNARVKVWAADGTFLRQFGAAGSGPGQFSNPRGIALDGLGNVYVADVGNGRVQKFTTDGTFVATIGAPYEFGSPFGVGVDPDGNLWVGDQAGGVVRKLTPTGTVLLTLPGFGQPVDLDFDSGGRVHILNFNDNRVRTYTLSGSYVDALALETNVIGLAINALGRLLVTMPFVPEVRVFDPPVPVDADHDGIADTIDAGLGAFDDHTGTTGSIVDAAGLGIFVTDARAPDGVQITVGPGSGKATFSVCGLTLKVAAGSTVVATCGSITAKIMAGSAEVVLGGGVTVVSIPAGATAKVSDLGGGLYTVQNIAGVAVTVTVDGIQATVAAGQSSTVAAWDFVGFASPVDNPSVLNRVKAGMAVPLKWRLLDGDGRPVTTLTTASIRVTSLNCSLAGGVDQVEETSAGGSGLQNLGNGYYQLNWKTPKSYAGSCKTLHLEIGDGVTHDALFELTR
jgi:hypothetical protein